MEQKLIVLKQKRHRHIYLDNSDDKEDMNNEKERRPSQVTSILPRIFLSNQHKRESQNLQNYLTYNSLSFTNIPELLHISMPQGKPAGEAMNKRAE